MVVGGDDLAALGNLDGGLADVGEVVPGDDLHVGHAAVRDEAGPRVQSCTREWDRQMLCPLLSKLQTSPKRQLTNEIKAVLRPVVHYEGVDRENAEDLLHLVDREILPESPGDSDQFGDLELSPLLGRGLVLLVVHQQAHLSRDCDQESLFGPTSL